MGSILQLINCYLHSVIVLSYSVHILETQQTRDRHRSFDVIGASGYPDNFKVSKLLTTCSLLGIYSREEG